MNDAERRIAVLEERLAFQERTLEQVSDALAAARAELDKLTQRLQRLETQVRSSSAGAGGNYASAEDETPPHY